MWSYYHKVVNAEMCYVKPMKWKEKKILNHYIEQKIIYFHSFSSYTFFLSQVIDL